MTDAQTKSASREALLPGVPLADVTNFVVAEAETHDLPLLERDEARLTVQVGPCQMSFAQGAGGVAITLRAPQGDQLYNMQEFLVDRLGSILPEAVNGLRWSGEDEAGAPPPSFRMITVRDVTPLGTDFLRVRISASDFALFTDKSIHFRILLPSVPIDQAEWPVLTENGATRWPTGDKALHRPVYTARYVDPEAGEMTFDVFRHDGGRVTDWAIGASEGTTVGFTGPGGGIPDARRIRLYGDETAFPAIARILETLSEDATGTVDLQCDTGADCGYPMPAHPGIRVTWHRRDSSPSLADLAFADRDDWTDGFLWFAGEKACAQKVRAAFKADGGTPETGYVAAYWTRP